MTLCNLKLLGYGISLHYRGSKLPGLVGELAGNKTTNKQNKKTRTVLQLHRYRRTHAAAAAAAAMFEKMVAKIGQEQVQSLLKWSILASVCILGEIFEGFEVFD